MSLALFVLGLFTLLLSATNSLTSEIRNNVEMQVYLNGDLSDTDIARLNKSLATQEFTLKNEDDLNVIFIAKEVAAEEFINKTGEDFMQFLGENPLKDAFIVKIGPDYQSADQMQEIKTRLEKKAGIFEVIYVENMVQSINENITKIGLILLAVAIILLVVIIILINNTIKLALFSQRFLIRSMQLVGATNSFIRSPFLYRSALHGFLAGVIASALLFGLYRYAVEKIEGLIQLSNDSMLFITFGGIILIGILIAVLGTRSAIQRYLAMSLEELY